MWQLRDFERAFAARTQEPAATRHIFRHRIHMETVEMERSRTLVGNGGMRDGTVHGAVRPSSVPRGNNSLRPSWSIRMRIPMSVHVYVRKFFANICRCI